MQVNSELWSFLEQRQTSLCTSAMFPRRKQLLIEKATVVFTIQLNEDTTQTLNSMFK